MTNPVTLMQMNVLAAGGTMSAVKEVKPILLSAELLKESNFSDFS